MTAGLWKIGRDVIQSRSCACLHAIDCDTHFSRNNCRRWFFASGDVWAKHGLEFSLIDSISQREEVEILSLPSNAISEIRFPEDAYGISSDLIVFLLLPKFFLSCIFVDPPAMLSAADVTYQ